MLDQDNSMALTTLLLRTQLKCRYLIDRILGKKILAWMIMTGIFGLVSNVAHDIEHLRLL